MPTAIIAGSTGLIGSELLKNLLVNNEFESIILLLRKPAAIEHPKLKTVIIDFNKLEEYSHELKAGIVFSCLGTTRAKTPDMKQYFDIEVTYPSKLLEIAKQNGATQFHYISSMGANSSSINSYSKNKGIAEKQLTNKEIQSLYLYRPSLLLGNRSENRPLEKISSVFLKIFNPLLIGDLKKYKAINATEVVKAMVHNSLNPTNGTHILLSDNIQELADRAGL